MSNLTFWMIFEPVIAVLSGVLIVFFMGSFLPSRYAGFKDWAGRIAIVAGCAAITIVFNKLEEGSPVTGPGPNTGGWNFLLTVILLLIYALIFLRGSVIKKLLTALSAQCLMTISSVLAVMLYLLVYRNTATGLLEQLSFAILNGDVDQWVPANIISKLLTELIYFFFGGVISGIFTKKNRLRLWQWLVVGINLLVAAVAGLIAAYVLMHSGNPNVSIPEMAVSRIFVVTCCLWLPGLLFYCLTVWMNRQNQRETERELTLQQQRHQSEQLRQMQENHEEMAQLQHDMKNYIASIQHLVETGENDLAAERCRELTGRVEQIQVYLQTDVPFVDAILNEKLSECKRKRINTKCSVVCEFKGVDAIAFCSVFGNLMDNAIEAEEKMPEEKRKIEIQIFSRYGFVFLRISNWIENSVLADNANLDSTKTDLGHHGIGHRSVEQTMKKLDGTISYEEHGDLFIAQAAFPSN